MSGGQTTSRSRVGLILAITLVAALAAAAGLGAAVLERQRPSLYSSHAVLLIDQEPALSLSHDDGIFNKLARLRVKYMDSVQTIVFADAVAPQAGVTSGRAHAALSASAAPISLLLTVQASDKDQAVSQLLAQTAAQTLQDNLTKEQAELGIPRDNRITLTLVSPAGTGHQVSPAKSRAVTVGAIAALAVLGAGLVLVAAVRRRRS